jgi:hypothetical protein
MSTVFSAAPSSSLFSEKANSDLQVPLKRGLCGQENLGGQDGTDVRLPAETKTLDSGRFYAPG